LVVEIARATGLNPISIINALTKEGSIAFPAGVVPDQLRPWQEETKTPQPSKKADQIRAEVRAEKQRYVRSFQFPQRGPKTTRKKVESRIVLSQAERVRIKISKEQESDKPVGEESKDFSPKSGGIGVAKNPFPEKSEPVIKRVLEKSSYWSGERKQLITPDLLVVNQSILDQVSQLAFWENLFLKRLIAQYRLDWVQGKRSKLTSLIEGNFAGSSLIGVLADWCLSVPPDESVTYFRPDLIVTRTETGETQPILCELNIVTAGTAPAILYREAQVEIFADLGISPATPGSLDFFFRLLGEVDQPILAIVGPDLPLSENQLLYEKSHQDMAKILSGYGIIAEYARIKDLLVKNSQLCLPVSGKAINFVYNRISPFRPETEEELTSSAGQTLLRLYQQGKIKIIPSPCLPFSDNKALEAIVWDDEFKGLVPEALKKFIPRTNFVYPGSPICQSIITGERSWQNFVLKSARAIGGGKLVQLGIERKREDFLAMINRAMAEPSQWIIQEFRPPEKRSFRIRGQDGQWKSKGFFLRLEPTIAISQGEIKITDLFFTGRFDTRKVGGANNCLMGIVGLKNDCL